MTSEELSRIEGMASDLLDAIKDLNPKNEVVSLPFSDRLRHLRSRRQMSQVRLAEESGVSVNAIIKLENGDSQPRLSTIYKLSQVLGPELREGS